jgi:uncharacterized phage protein (TIGR02218 family)
VVSKGLDSAQQAVYDQTATQITRCLRIDQTNGTSYYFTSLDRDVEISGDVYKSAGGFSATAYESSTGLAVDNAEISALTDEMGLSDDEVIAGRLDGAEWEVFEYDYEGNRVLATKGIGVLGEYKHAEGLFTIELRSLAQKLNQSVGFILQKKCRHALYDSICRAPTVGNTFSGTVTTPTSRTQFVGSAVPVRPLGKITFTSGDNVDVTGTVRAVSGSTITLEFPVPFDLDPGVTYTVLNGCNKTFEQCKLYGQELNFGGFKDMPGNDALRSPPNVA